MPTNSDTPFWALDADADGDLDFAFAKAERMRNGRIRFWGGFSRRRPDRLSVRRHHLVPWKKFGQRISQRDAMATVNLGAVLHTARSMEV